MSTLKVNLGYIVYNSIQSSKKPVTIVLKYENQGVPTAVCNSLDF